ncbi:MAG: hypothetical protein K6B44_13800 [Lachnospiraceae bacterium]|nr:hypothetical protein [Lachnospiraceae bacterium]
MHGLKDMLIKEKNHLEEIISKVKAELRLKQISGILRDYEDDEIEQVYLYTHMERQHLITPVEPTLKQLLDCWINETYKGKEFQEGATVILSEKGERVWDGVSGFYAVFSETS